MIFGALAPLLPADWRLMPIALAIMLAGFAASGLPMYVGDVNRDRAA